MSDPYSLQTNDSRLEVAVEIYAYRRAANDNAGFKQARRAAVALLTKASQPNSPINDDLIRFTRNLASQIDGFTDQQSLEDSAGLVVDLMALQLLDGDRSGNYGDRAHRRVVVLELIRDFKGDGDGLSAPDRVYKAFADRNGIDGPIVAEASKGFAATVLQEVPSVYQGRGDGLVL